MSDVNEIFDFEKCVHKKECDQAIAKLKDDYEKKIEALKGEYRISPSKAIIGLWKLITDPATIAFVVFTVIASLMIFNTLIDSTNTKYIIFGWIGVAVLFIVFKSLSKSISVAIENTKINIEAKAAWTKALNLTGDVGEALKNIPANILKELKK